MKAVLRLCLVVAALVAPSFAQRLKVLHSFSQVNDGNTPLGGLIRDAQGNLYGTAFQGGINTSVGTVFKLAPFGTESFEHNFAGIPDGGSPMTGMIRDSAGNFYGSTSSGGTNGTGTVFKINAAGNESVIYSFGKIGSGDGESPQYGRITRDSAGNLYGMTTWGGLNCVASNYGCGIVYKIDASGHETILHKFTGGADGGVPYGSVLKVGADLYGTTYSGGSGACTLSLGCGVAFKLDAEGNETVIHNFSTSAGDGNEPTGGLIADQAGNLYGTTTGGGAVSSCGTVFKLDASGNETILHSFACNDDGSGPWDNLVRDAAGNLYGATPYGGKFNCGTVYKIDAEGNETILHTFTCGPDGGMPFTDLLLDAAGNVYGTTMQGGGLECNRIGCGVVFKVTP